MSQVFARRWLWLLIGLLLLAACQPQTPPPDIPEVAVLPSPTDTEIPILPTDTPVVTPTPVPPTSVPTITYTPSATWTPYIVIATYTPSVTYTPSLTYTPSNTPTETMTFTPTSPPTFTPTKDQPAPVVVAVAPDVSSLKTPRDERCVPTTTTITASIESSVGLYTLRLNYVINGVESRVVDMVNQEGSLYTAELGPFDQPGRVAYWLSMADNWGKWTTSSPQEIVVEECDVNALNATAAAAATLALTATAQFGFNPAAFAAQDQDLNTPYQTPITVTFAAVNGIQPYTFLINSNPANGTLTTIDARRVEYRPNNGFIGDDTFTYLATDSTGQTDVGVVRINVGTDPLVALSQTISVPYNATDFAITLQAQDGTTPYVSVSIETPPGQGTLTPDGSDRFRYYYTPPAGFLGTTSFVWSVTDSAPAIAQGTITLNVGAPAPTGRIVFASDSSGDWEIYTMNADGTGITNVSNAPGSDERYPSWSPDRSQIAFVSNADGDNDIYVMAAAGSLASATNLTGPDDPGGSSDTQPAWSPNGSYIAFVSNRAAGGSDNEIWRMSNAGGPPEQLTFNVADDQNPAWSPDSGRIVYQSGNQIATILWNDGSAPSVLTSAGNNIEPAWSSAGQIAFASDRDGTGSYELYRMAADGSGQTRVLVSPSLDDRGPVWSPDGSQILYTAISGGADNIQRVWLDGSNQALVASDARDPDWKP